MASKQNKSNRPKDSLMALAPTPEDVKLAEELRAHFEAKIGKVSNSTLLRMGLRKLAESEGIR